jgi:ABC-type transport system involved in multi-copper enzyme maturation permease subunit
MFKCVIRSWALAKITILDGMRCHVILGLLLFALAAESSGQFFYQFIPRNIDQFTFDFVLSIGWLIGLLFLFFHAVQTVSWGGGKRTIQAILARPLSRANYVIGLFLGLALLLCILNFLVALLGYWNILAIRKAVPVYFHIFSIFWYVISWLGMLTMELMILSVILFFSSIMRGGFPVLLLTICYYFICNGIPVIRESLTSLIKPPESLVTTLRWLTLIFPNFNRLDYRTYILNSEHLPSFTFHIYNSLYSFLYIIFFLCLASIIYQQRDLT